MKRVVDLQAHILHGLEGATGPQTLEESVQIVKDLVALGVTDIFATPRVDAGVREDGWNAIRQGVDTLQGILDEQSVPVTIHAGAVVTLSDDMLTVLKENTYAYRLGNSHFILVDIGSDNKLHHVDAWLKTLRQWGLTPVLSQLECHKALFQRPERLLKWVDSGILVQCNIDSFSLNSDYRERALSLYKNGLIHFFGTGYHNTTREYVHFLDAVSELDDTYKRDLLSEIQLNERDLLADRLFYPAVPPRWKGDRRGIWARLLSFTL